MSDLGLSVIPQSRFAQRAAEILDTAESALMRGGSFSEITILIDPHGTPHLVANSDWPLDSLAAHHGALSAYRVVQDQGKVRVVGRESGRTCILESSTPLRSAYRLLLG